MRWNTIIFFANDKKNDEVLTHVTPTNFGAVPVHNHVSY